jgi:chemotaxis protein methyltransferase CheR
MDLILCRNVLMYFDSGQVKKVIHHFYRSLVEGGWLIVSPSEASHTLFPQFDTVNLPGVIFYKKAALEETDILPFNESPPPPLPVSPLPPVTDPSTIPRAEPRSTPYAEAAALVEQGRYTEAEARGGEWCSLPPDDADAMTLLSRIHANQGKLTEAFLWCEKALAADRLHPGRHYLLATILQEQGRIETAAASLKRALYLDPNFVLAHFALGNLAWGQGKLNEAEKHFENARSLLTPYRQDDLLPESDGITAGRLLEILRAAVGRETSA